MLVTRGEGGWVYLFPIKNRFSNNNGTTLRITFGVFTAVQSGWDQLRNFDMPVSVTRHSTTTGTDALRELRVSIRYS